MEIEIAVEIAEHRTEGGNDVVVQPEQIAQEVGRPASAVVEHDADRELDDVIDPKAPAVVGVFAAIKAVRGDRPDRMEQPVARDPFVGIGGDERRCDEFVEELGGIARPGVILPVI